MTDAKDNWDQHLTVETRSDVGMRRSNNQDNYAVSLASQMEQWRQSGHLFLIADGMGAHAAGELASEIASQQFPHLYRQYASTSIPEAMKQAMQESNAAIYQRGQANEEFHNMGTTCSAMTIVPQGAIISHVGDSRIYRVRKNRLEQLTFDHSLVWEMQAAGQFKTEKEAEGVVPKNVITRSLGPYPKIKVDLEGPFPVEVGDVYLLCSDGLTGPIEDDELGPLLANLPPKEAADVLVDLANLRGGPDNITLTIIRIDSAEMATGSSSADPITIGGNSKNQPKLPDWFWTAWGASLGAAVLAFFALNPWASIAPFLLVVIGLVWLAIHYSKKMRSSTVVTAGKRFGKGPHVKINCTSSEKFVKILQSTVSELQSEAEKQSYLSDIGRLDQLLDQANAAIAKQDWKTAIRVLARTIRHMMSQIRHHFKANAHDSHIDL